MAGFLSRMLGKGRGNDAAPPGIVFEHEREVVLAALAAMTGRFGADLAAIGWTYDGRNCAVETGETR